MADKKKKGIFGKVTDALSSKDEKEEIAKLKDELEKTKKEAEASKEAIKSLLDQNREKSAVSAEVEKAEEKVKELENKLKAKEREKMIEDREKLIEERRKIKEERMAKLEKKAESKNIATHTVVPGETLSHIALKYYKHATPPYWKHLLEHNSEALQGNEKNLRAGMEIEIPELPEDLKD